MLHPDYPVGTRVRVVAHDNDFMAHGVTGTITEEQNPEWVGYPNPMIIVEPDVTCVEEGKAKRNEFGNTWAVDPREIEVIIEDD